MDKKSSQFFHIMSCAKLKSAGPVRSLLYFGGSVFCEETRFGSLPISIPSFCESTGYYDCQSFSNIKAHLKRLNANLISYMKQSWFTFLPKSSNNHPTHSPHPPYSWNHAFQHPVKGMGKCSVDSCHDPPAPNPPSPPKHTHNPFSFSSSWYLPTAGAAASPKITVILKDKYIGNFIYTMLT